MVCDVVYGGIQVVECCSFVVVVLVVRGLCHSWADVFSEEGDGVVVVEDGVLCVGDDFL